MLSDVLHGYETQRQRRSLTIKGTLTTEESNLDVSGLFNATCRLSHQVPSPNRPRRVHINYTQNITDECKGRVYGG